MCCLKSRLVFNLLLRHLTQGSVATHLSYGGIFSDDIITNVLLILSVKYFRKSVNIWLSRTKYCANFWGPPCRGHRPPPSLVCEQHQQYRQPSDCQNWRQFETHMALPALVRWLQLCLVHWSTVVRRCFDCSEFGADYTYVPTQLNLNST